MRNNIAAAATMIVLQLISVLGAQAANYSLPTAKQGALRPQTVTVTGMPMRNSYLAPGNLALQQMGGKSLPPTRLDSFVAESGYNDAIYGDEGTDGPPPYAGFTADNRINAGIYGACGQGLTTNHGSVLPSAWGNDEYSGAQEWSLSGSTGLNPVYLQQAIPQQAALAADVQSQLNAVADINPWQDAEAAATQIVPQAQAQITQAIPYNLEGTPDQF